MHWLEARRKPPKAEKIAMQFRVVQLLREG
jgi:hypothetical protein